MCSAPSPRQPQQRKGARVGSSLRHRKHESSREASHRLHQLDYLGEIKLVRNYERSPAVSPRAAAAPLLRPDFVTRQTNPMAKGSISLSELRAQRAAASATSEVEVTEEGESQDGYDEAEAEADPEEQEEWVRAASTRATPDFLTVM